VRRFLSNYFDLLLLFVSFRFVSFEFLLFSVSVLVVVKSKNTVDGIRLYPAANVPARLRPQLQRPVIQTNYGRWKIELSGGAFTWQS